MTDKVIWPYTEMQSTSEEPQELTNIEKPSTLITLMEGNIQKYTTYVSHTAFPPGIKSYDERLTPATLGSWNDSLAARLSPPALDSIGKAIHTDDIFLHPPLTATFACYGRVVLLMLPFTRTAETVVLIEHFYNAISNSPDI